MQDDAIKQAIRKVALGYSVAEVTEEYGVQDGELKLLKRKETTKDIPPDLKAAKLLMEDGYGDLSDEELAEERKKLLALLEESGEGKQEDTSWKTR